MPVTQHGAAPPPVDAVPPEQLIPSPAIVPFTVPRGYLPPPTVPRSGAVAVPPPSPRPHPVLGRLTLSLALLSVGVIVIVDMAGASVPASVYFAVPLAVVGGGLVLGAWYGRARGMIGLGVVLSVLLAVAAGIEVWGPAGSHGSVTWRPATVQQMAPSYRVDAGHAVLDLSEVDFTDHAATITAHVSVGTLRIVLPRNVDVEVRSAVGVGNAVVLGQRWDGIGQGEHIVTDNGPDGPGGGNLTVDATVNVGNLEVRR